MSSTTEFNAKDYERRYQEGYGHAYPEAHIIRVNNHILDRRKRPHRRRPSPRGRP